jgi:hypothetical protein
MFFPKRWHLLTSLHGAKTQKNIILTTVKTSNLTAWSEFVFVWDFESILGEYGVQ